MVNLQIPEKPMKTPPIASGRTRVALSTLASASLLASLPAFAQITANDDGSTGSPFASTGEDTVLDTTGGLAVTSNDTGVFTVLNADLFSALGATVSVNPDGTLSFDPRTSGSAQALASGESLEDTFSYTLLEVPPVAAGVTSELNPTTNVNTGVWNGLGAPVVASGTGRPETVVMAYSMPNGGTRADYTGAGDTEPASFEFWIRPDSIDTSQVLFESGGTGTGGAIVINDDGTVSAVIRGGGSGPLIVQSSTVLTLGQWYHVVVTFDLGAGGATDTLSLYIDGSPDGSATKTDANDWSGVDDAGVGRNNNTTAADNTNVDGDGVDEAYGNFIGQMGVFRYYRNKVLTSTEITDNRNAALTGVFDGATVTLEVTGANDAPDGVNDIFLTGPSEDDASFTSTRNLLENDGKLATQAIDVSAPGSNLSLSKIPTIQTSQSPTSASPPGGGVPSRGIDGNASTFTHTDANVSVDHNWTLDFGVATDVEEVILANRSDCCGIRLRDITIRLEDQSGTLLVASPLLNPGNAEGFTGAGGQPGLSYDFAAANSGNPITGVYRVVVTRSPDLADTNTSNGSVLSLGEVTVLGSASALGSAQELTVHHDARTTAGAGRWENLGTLGGTQADWVLGTGVSLNSSVVSARSQITAAYEWDGTANATAILDNGAFENLAGSGLDTRSVTIELWAKLGAADLTQTTVLFETGGSAGLGIAVDNGVLQFATGNQTGLVSYDLVGDPDSAMGGLSPTADFFQVTAVLDQATDTGRLYVNGQLVGAETNGTTDWSGSDQAGLGRFRGTNAGGLANPASGTDYDSFFHGSIASFSLWDDALGGGQVRQNFEAVANGTDVDGDSFMLAGVIDANQTLVPINSPATLPSGAIVTLTDATGSFTYEPNGAFDALQGGEVVVDSFLYQIGDGNGGIGVAEVSLPISGLTDAIDDTLAATELIVTNLPANFLVGNDQRAAPSAGPYFNIDPTNFSGGSIPNSGTGGSAFNLTVTAGGVIMPPTLQSNFGAIGAALQNGTGSFTSLNSISGDDATFEIWFQPTPFQSGNQILLDSGGGGNGLSIIYDADLNRIVFTVDGGNDTNDIIQAIATGVVPGEFNQLVAIYDKDASGVADDLAVYLNSDPASFDGSVKGSGTNAGGTANVWAGSDLSGLGDYTGTAALGETPLPFVGQIGITRIYDRKLSLAEIENNFDSVVQPITGLVGGSPVTTALGAIVTLNADGSISYDATSLNSDIPDGNVVQDTFQYEIDNGAGGTTTATVTVDVTGVGTFLAVDDDFTVTEDDAATALDVRANDLDAGSATVLFQALESGYTSSLSTFAGSATIGDPADFTDGSGYGWRLLWNPPSDWDLLNDPASSVGTGGALGDAANYVPLIWTGTEWTPDGDGDDANNEPANFGTLQPNGAGHAAAGSSNAGTTGNDEDRAMIAAYTVPATGYYGIANSVVESLSGSGTGLRALVYVENTEVINVSIPGAGTGNFDGAVGLVNQGETIYIAISPDGTASFDSFEWDFDLVTLPGPDAVPTVTLGTVSTDGSNILYTPASAFQALKQGESITETISYTIDDGGTLSTATITVTIDGVNDLPVGVADAGGSTNENRILMGGGLLDNDTDPDTGEALNLVVGQVEGSAGNVGVPVVTALGGSVTVNADGSFIYDPTGAFDALDFGDPNAVDSFTYTVQDENGADAAGSTTVTIEVIGLEINLQATGFDLTQGIEYLSGSTEVGFFIPPTIGDPNAGNTVTSAVFSEFATTTNSSFTLPSPTTATDGFSVAVQFTPDSADLAPGARAVVYENGGTSNGNGIYLLDGIPHFVGAMNSSGLFVPTSRNDPDWDNGKVCVPLSGSALDVGLPVEIGIVFSLDALDFTINGSVPVTIPLTGRTTQTNWSGSNTLNFGNLDSSGNRGALATTGDLDFDVGLYSALSGTIEYGEIWFDGRVENTGLTPELLTATLTVNPAEGALTAPTGASYDGGTGTWTATGHEELINALLAATTFAPNGTSPVNVAVSIADGGEGGTTPETGTLTFTAIVADEGTDGDGDSLSDFLERAFGTDPGVSDNADLAIDGSVNGRPIINVDFSGGLTFEAVFVRRDDHGVPGSLNYTVEFSGDLVTWEASTDPPTILADSTDDPDYEVVSVPYPFFVDGKKARFFRVRVEPVN